MRSIDGNTRANACNPAMVFTILAFGAIKRQGQRDATNQIGSAEKNTDIEKKLKSHLVIEYTVCLLGVANYYVPAVA